MNTSMSRRSMIAGAAAILPAASIAAERTPPDGFHLVVEENGRRWFKADADDPIFAAIDRHRVAAERFHVSAAAWCGIDRDDPQFSAIDRGHEADSSENVAASAALLDVLPNSFAGVVALLDYVDRFDRGELGGVLAGHTDADLWPDVSQETESGDVGGREFHSRMLRHALAALRTMEGRNV